MLSLLVTAVFITFFPTTDVFLNMVLVDRRAGDPGPSAALSGA